MDCRGDSVHEGNWHTASLCGCLEDGLQAFSFSIHTPESSIQTPGVGAGGLALPRRAVREGRISASLSRHWLCGPFFFTGALRGVEDSWDTLTALLSGTHSEGKWRLKDREREKQWPSPVPSLHHHHPQLPPLPLLLPTCLSHYSTSWMRPEIIESHSMALLHDHAESKTMLDHESYKSCLMTISSTLSTITDDF